MVTKTRARPYHHGDLKRALLDASIELIREEGVEALTVAEIGRRVGVSSAAPYKHFADRQALLRALAMEGNRRLGEALIAGVGGTLDPQEAFRRSGIAFIRWAAENPALYRIATDPAYIDYASTDSEAEVPDALKGSMDTFWPELGALVRSGSALSASHPLMEQLRGRALAHGLASLFVSGAFASLGVATSDAERLARAVIGEDVPATTRRGRPPRTR
ncbi:TetR/AcrR family transcriptional regulator [Corallococcus macrosporus]|uniref:TetR family transcriptional regulator n=1 Tax=Myxococcus fulvus (strain ATCC BAA-855 / HW-1) TaxID=483219 RepID=F8CB21_MYXFH|nr:TetR family transcriptional regulator [Corallococcus macrosporus]AEI68402.1 TetR family transcriptional regulator [Corallococcus macrosporus]